MFGVKRSSLSACPDRPQSKIAKDDGFSIYESTLRKLRDGSGLVFSSNMSKPAETKVSGQENTTIDATSTNGRNASAVTAPCKSKSNVTDSLCLCSSQNRGITCSSCRRIICEMCFHLCEHCHERFCKYCTIYNFCNQYDHMYCLECNLREATRKH